jgi:hypothetical protein
MTRRRYHSSYDIPETQYTPFEDILLDTTAWLVAASICLSPTAEYDDLEKAEQMHKQLDDKEGEQKKERRRK